MHGTWTQAFPSNVNEKLYVAPLCGLHAPTRPAPAPRCVCCACPGRPPVSLLSRPMYLPLNVHNRCAVHLSGVLNRQRTRHRVFPEETPRGELQGAANRAEVACRVSARRGALREGAVRSSLPLRNAVAAAAAKVKVKVGKSLHKLNFPVLTSSFRPLFDLPDAPSAVPPTSSERVPGRPVPKPWRF